MPEEEDVWFNPAQRRQITEKQDFLPKAYLKVESRP
jgi:hypothetical protein